MKRKIKAERRNLGNSSVFNADTITAEMPLHNFYRILQENKSTDILR